jgi:hypothetical protein
MNMNKKLRIRKLIVFWIVILLALLVSTTSCTVLPVISELAQRSVIPTTIAPVVPVPSPTVKLPAQTSIPYPSPVPTPSSPSVTPVAINTALPIAEQQIQLEAYKFNELLEEFMVFITDIKNPCDIDLKKVLPDNWLFEIYSVNSSSLKQYALAMPIPADLRKGWDVVSTTREGISFKRVSRLNPDTNLYIAPTWNSQPRDWTYWTLNNMDVMNYPRPVKSDYFVMQKICLQPYMIPDEATHGIYTGDWINKNCNITSLVTIVRDVREANPYQERSFIEQYKTPSISTILAPLPDEIKKVTDDVNSYLVLVNSLDKTFFTPNTSIYNKRSELEKYKIDMTKITEQLNQIDNYVKKIKAWDFSNLEKYRSLKNK